MPTSFPVATNADMGGGGWPPTGAATVHEAIDDPAADNDTTYIVRAIGGASLTGFPAVQLGAVVDPGTDSGFSLVFTRRNTSSGTSDLTVELYQGDPAVAGTLLDTFTLSTNTTFYGDQTRNIPDAAIAAVTNFADLWVGWNTPGGGGGNLRITRAVMNYPDPVTARERAKMGVGA